MRIVPQNIELVKLYGVHSTGQIYTLYNVHTQQKQNKKPKKNQKMKKKLKKKKFTRPLLNEKRTHRNGFRTCMLHKIHSKYIFIYIKILNTKYINTKKCYGQYEREIL